MCVGQKGSAYDLVMVMCLEAQNPSWAPLPAVISLILSVDLSSRDRLEVPPPHALEHDRARNVSVPLLILDFRYFGNQPWRLTVNSCIPQSSRPIISRGVMTAVAPRFGSEDRFDFGRAARIRYRKVL